MPLPRIQRGEFWLVDLGYLGIQAAKFVRRLGALSLEQLSLDEHTLAQVLGLKLAIDAPRC